MTRGHHLMLVFFTGFATLIAGYFLFGEPLIVAAYNREAPEFLNDLIENSDNGPIDYYVAKGRVVLSRVLIYYCAAFALFTACIGRHRLIAVVKSYFTEEDSPINLAVFRIALFAVLFVIADPAKVSTFASLPDELREPPTFGGQLLAPVLFDPDLATGAAMVLRAVCVFGIVGLCSRSSAFLAAILGMYVLGIPQCFGKVNHYHHVIWFTVILAGSPCGHALSIDAMIRNPSVSISRKLLGPPPSPSYALPLRLAWLLFGVIYFFPGFWKFWTCGYEWAMAANLKFQLYHKWAELGGWEPFIRVDRYPLLLTAAGLATIVFEMGFFWMLFQRNTRLLAAASGIVFHNMTNTFMAISFWNLQVLYVAFVPWDRILGAAQRKVQHSQAPVESRQKVALIAGVGGVLLAANISLGFMKEMNAWPCACYPTFDSIMAPDRQQVEFRRLNVDGSEEAVSLDAVRQVIPPERLAGMVRLVLAEKQSEQRQRKANALGGVVRRLAWDATDLRRILIYSVKYSTLPGEQAAGPIDEKLIWEIEPFSRENEAQELLGVR